jgi:predicted ester cyclase
MAGEPSSVAGPGQRALVETLVRRLLDEVFGGGRLDVIEELYTPAMAGPARRWIEPFLRSFPDARMELITLVFEGDTAVGRFRCSGTHLGTWRGHPPTGRRFSVDEVYFFTIVGGRIGGAWGLEDTHRRLRQLGLAGTGPPRR